MTNKEARYDWHDIDHFSDWVEKDLSSLLLVKPDCVVGILNGGAVPALIISNYFKVPLCWVRVSSYKERERREVKFGYREYLEDMKSKHIIVADEITDSGETIKVVLEWLKDFNPKKISVVTMISKSEQDVICMVKEPKDVWCIFPWEA